MNNHANKYGMPSLWILHQTVDCQWGSWTCEQGCEQGWNDFHIIIYTSTCISQAI